MRKTKEQLDALKEKFGVDILWSWSRYNTYKIDPYGYYLKYIKHEKETKTSIYCVSGGNCHDIIEKFYNKEIKYEDMISLYEENLFQMNLSNLKYNRKDEKANESMANKYENNIRLFYKNHIPIEGKNITEQFVTIKVGSNVFQGYIDFITRDKNGDYHIIDWKTSTIYTGKKVLKESGQLILYAESLIQRGVPIDKIHIKWNFLKYCTVQQTLITVDKETKLHKLRNKNCLRTEWVKGIEPNLRKWLKKIGFNELEIEDSIETSIENNNLDNMPPEIQSKFKILDCYVEIPLTQEIINNLKKDIIKTIDEISYKEEQYNKNKDDHLFWTNIDQTNEFFFANLSGYSSSQHKPYKEYLNNKNLFKDNQNKKKNDDIDWLNDL